MALLVALNLTSLSSNKKRSQTSVIFTDCEHSGKQYKVGENFPKGDNCNRCSCGPNGLVNCTDKYCKKEQCMFRTKM